MPSSQFVTLGNLAVPAILAGESLLEALDEGAAPFPAKSKVRVSLE